MPRNGVGVGFIGAGNVLGAYLQLLDRLVPRGVAWVGPVCARDRSRWSDLSARRPGIVLVDDPEAVLASDVSVVVVITAPSSHAELTRAALRAGKHVVCEKPLGRSRAEAAAAFVAAEEAGLHLLAAPFVHLSPTMRELWTRVADGEIGEVHTARAMYGNNGAPWADWYRKGEIGPLAEVGIYNLKSLTALLGPAVEVQAAEAEPATVQLVIRHRSGALSSVCAAFGISRYRRPAIELYGTAGTANLLGDDWDPTGIEIWRDSDGVWSTHDSRDPTWSWADGLAELVAAVAHERVPLAYPQHDLHVLDLIDMAAVSATEGRAVRVESSHEVPDLRIDLDSDAGRIHDHTRSPADQ